MLGRRDYYINNTKFRMTLGMRMTCISAMVHISEATDPEYGWVRVM